jgi:hypothetical protein
MSELTDKYSKNFSASKKKEFEKPNPQGLNIPLKQVKT